MAVEVGSPAASLHHLALLYRGASEYSDAVARFARAGLAAGERVLIAVPRGKLDVLHRALGSRRDGLSLTDMASLGRNPARIIPAIQDFVSAGRLPVRFIGEPVWPGRTAAEIREATKHEALINLAFAASDATILCPYDAAGLPVSVLADARQTHPFLVSSGSRLPSLAYAGAGSVPESCTGPLAPPPSGATVLRYDTDLRELRRFVAERARTADLSATRAADLVLAVSEIAANTIRHSAGGGTILLWRTAAELICELRDAGQITDPLAGRRVPDPEQAGGHGLWLVNRSVDLAEMRTGPGGTVTRLHVTVPPGWRRAGQGHRPAPC
jgi:anti-sigma regulatory factor (Ser/Thr protein kinase)